MAAYKVIWSHGAARDLSGIVEYIAASRPQTAKSVFSKLRKMAETLAHHPLKGRLVPELRAYEVVHCRELIHQPWRLLYRIDRQTVYVLALIDSRRNIEDILLDRMIEL